MLLPYRCYAPMYYFPFVTIGLVVCNIFVMLAVWFGWMNEATFVDHWVLHHDGNWRVHQLLTSLFAHADFWHLLGNMVSLWAFGLIIEGKVGAIKMLAIYLGVGLSSECA